ncbi:MAG TPA: hypothetical protein VEA15_05170, partial [Caulobacteraceae bacterium]|nr:hypothetical protein [Caulobacteraceae bacterium]
MRVRTRQPLNLSAPEEVAPSADAAVRERETDAAAPANAAPTGIEPAAGTLTTEPETPAAPRRPTRFGRSARLSPPAYQPENRFEPETAPDHPAETPAEQAIAFSIPDPEPSPIVEATIDLRAPSA